MTNSYFLLVIKHKKILVVSTVVLLMLFAMDALQAHGMSDAEKRSIIEGGNLRYMKLGATHMLTGYDHLAFVFGIVFFLRSFKDIAKYVTAFTFGHSITLIIATFNGIQLNYYLIEAIIALSVCYIAFANLDGFRRLLMIRPPNMLLMVVGLGLIHGLGLSTRLQELPLSEDQLLMNIISFNIGIELGQIAALVAMLVIISLLRTTRFFQPFSLIVSYGLLFLGAVLFLKHMHAFEHRYNVEEFAPEELHVEADAAVIAPNSGSSWKDTLNIVLPAGDGVEYKVIVEADKSFFYEWSTDSSPLYFDFHGERAGDTSGAFQSYEIDTDSSSKGMFTATFSGTHGWYWENRSGKTVTVTLNLKGDYQQAN